VEENESPVPTPAGETVIVVSSDAPVSVTLEPILLSIIVPVISAPMVGDSDAPPSLEPAIIETASETPAYVAPIPETAAAESSAKGLSWWHAGIAAMMCGLGVIASLTTGRKPAPRLLQRRR
jgi:hypothetical protein